MRLSVVLLTLFSVGALVVAACGGENDEDPDPTATQELTQEEQTYLGQLATAFRRSSVNFQRFDAALAQSYSSPEAILMALVTAGAGTTFDPVLEGVEELDPPARFESDHQVLVEAVRAMVEIDQGIGAAAADEDIVGFELGNLDLLLEQMAMRLEISNDVCLRLSDLREFCKPDGELPAGDYGAELDEVMRRFAAEFNPRVGVLNEGPQGPFLSLTFVPLYTPEELAEVYGAVETETLAVLADASSAVDALEPPDDFKADHARLQSWFEETSQVFEALFDATGEDDRNERGSLQEQGRIAYCTAADEFSPQAMVLVGVVFDNLPGGGAASEFCA